MAITPNQWSHVLTIPESYTPSAPTSGQTLVITESVIAKLSAGDQATFWSNVQNGGGDVRICTSPDGTGQLPVEVVSLNNTAKTCIIWTRKPNFDGTGNLYLFIGKAGETQPPVTDPFGRNAVWQDFELVIHQGTTTDSTGNHSPFLLGNPSLAPMMWGGQGYDLDANTKWVQIADALGLDIAKDYTISLWYDGNGAGALNGTAYVDKVNSSNSDGFRVLTGGNNQLRVRHPDLSPSNMDGVDSESGKKLISSDFDGSTRRSFINASQIASDSPAGAVNNVSDDLYIGHSIAFPTDAFNGVLGEFWLSIPKRDNDFQTEYANQNDPASFFGTPTLAETGDGGGLNISPLGIPTQEVFGSITLETGGVFIGAVGVPSQEAVGLTTLEAAGVNIQPEAISSEEGIGDLDVIPLGVSVSADAIGSSEVVNQPSVDIGLTVVAPNSIASEEVVPNPTLERLLTILLAPSIPNTFSVGRPIVAGGDRIVIPVVSRTNFTEMQRYLTTLGFKGALEDVILTWLRSEGYEGQWNDAWYAYLEAEGLEGSLTDKRSKWRNQ